MQNIALRRGVPHPRDVTVIACGAGRRRRPAAIPSGRVACAGYAQTPAAPRTRADARNACGSHGPGLSLPDPPNPRPARYTAVAATQTASGTRRRAVAHGHANASATRAGGIPPFVMPVADCAATWRASGHPFLLPVRFPSPQVPSAPSKRYSSHMSYSCSTLLILWTAVSISSSQMWWRSIPSSPLGASSLSSRQREHMKRQRKTRISHLRLSLQPPLPPTRQRVIVPVSS